MMMTRSPTPACVQISTFLSGCLHKRMLGGLKPAPLVFTDTELPDGTWADILTVAERAACPVNVVVVARVVDTRFYVQAMEAGAFDFMVPPFNATDLTHVVRCAADNVLTRRAAYPRTIGLVQHPCYKLSC